MRTQKRRSKVARTVLALILVLLLAFGGVMTVMAANQSDQASGKANENASFKDVVEEEPEEVVEEENEEIDMFVEVQMEEEPFVAAQVEQCNSAEVSRNQLNNWGVEQTVDFSLEGSVTFTLLKNTPSSGQNTLVFSSTVPITSLYIRHSNMSSTIPFGGVVQGEYVFPGKQIHELIFNPCGEVVPPATHNVIYDGSDETAGDAPTDSGDYAEGDQVIVLGQGSLTKDGYTFDGWMTDDLGATTQYFDEDDTFNMPAKDVTLYAVWVEDDPDIYTVTYDANGGEGDVPTDDGEYEEDDEVTVLGQGSLTRDGYTFDGWMTDDLGEDTEYFDEDDTFDMPAKDVTLYAVWNEDQNGGGPEEPIIFTVTFDGNGGTPDIQTEDVEEGETVESLPSVSRSGYSFVRWDTESDGSGNQFTASTIVTEDITVYAIWSRRSSSSGTSRTPAIPRENVPEFVEEILEVVVEPQIPAAPPVVEAPVLDAAPLAAPPVLPQTGDAGALATILSGLGVTLSGLAMKFRKKGKDDSVTTLFK